MFVIWFDEETRQWCVLRANGHMEKYRCNSDALADVADNCFSSFELADLIRERARDTAKPPLLGDNV